jgi:predicted ferric reductase
VTTVTVTASYHGRRPADPGAGITPPSDRLPSSWPAPRSAEPAIALAIGSLLVTTGLWVAGGGLPALATAPLTSLGRLAGLLAADLLLIQVLLMARIPWLERSAGQDVLARHHRTAGFTSFWLMITHIGLITLGYAATDGNGALDETWQLITTAPGMLLAAAGTAALVAVVVLSIRAARRRLRYESWHLIHLYAYLGIGLALPHQLWNGGDLTFSPVAQVYWCGLYLLTLGAVLVYRLGLPAWRTLYHRLRVAAVVIEAPGVISVYFTGHNLQRLPARAGQFFNWRFLDGPGWSRAHPYSLSAAPRPDWLRITVKDVDGSGRLSRLRPGTRVLIEGPYGVLTGTRRQRPQVLLAAAGVGITPLRALLDELTAAPGGLTLLYRVSSRTQALFGRELEAIAAARGVRLCYLEGPRAAGSAAWLPVQLAGAGGADVLRRLVPDVRAHDVYLCGPAPWTDALRASLASAGVPAQQLHTEQFSW